MNDSLTLALYAEFPDLYAGRFKSAEVSSMCWGFECGDGWYDLLKTLSRDLTNYALSNPQFHVEVAQVKSKFGSLRFHLVDNTSATEAIVGRAREVAGRTCERTGASGTHCVKRAMEYRGVRYMVLCDEKAAEHGYEKANPRDRPSDAETVAK